MSAKQRYRRNLVVAASFPAADGVGGGHSTPMARDD
jgi:hypothetical protein